MKQSDLDFVKQRAKDIGISYQNIIQALIHNYAHGKVEFKVEFIVSSLKVIWTIGTNIYASVLLA
ncbi:MAG: hypothetical protein Q7U28_00175 [Aquabacterium sp.]|nr:hypothetical protein [Aquabacterium sp.]